MNFGLWPVKISPMCLNRLQIWAAVCAFLACATCATGQNATMRTTMPDLASMDIEDLMDIQVTVASKKPETLLNTASAVYVLTQEDIRRSGATHVAEALRMIRGLNVSSVSSSGWAVSSRGFNARPIYSNKLLVLVDGRSVYSPLLSGTFWEMQDLVMEDIDRIEVIRGPGAAM